MAKHVALGHRVCTMAPYHGMRTHLKALDTYSKTGQMPDIDALIKDREEELINAAKALEVNDVRFLSHDDDITVPDKQIINEIADVIGDIRPDIIITRWPYDSVPAYANATQMTLLAMDELEAYAVVNHIVPTKSPKCSTMYGLVRLTYKRVCFLGYRPHVLTLVKSVN